MKKIMFITFLLSSIVILCEETTIAQNTTFKLSDYKNPDYLYQSLDLNFGMNSTLDFNKNTSTSVYTQNTYSLHSNAMARYSSSANSAKSQTEKYLSLGAGIGSGGNHKNNVEYLNHESKDNYFNHDEQLNISGLKRYYNEKQDYFEFSASSSTAYGSGSSKTKTLESGTISRSTESKGKNFGTYAAGAFLIGKGRIEQVQDARLAMYLLDDLNKLNRVKHSGTGDDVIALARVITALKYKRFFDDRLRKMAEIAAIDSFMQNRRIAGNPDATYFTSLNDNWNFANNPARYSGRRIFTGVEADFAYNYTDNNEQDIFNNARISSQTNKFQQGSIYAVAGFNYEKPLSTEWQRSANLKAGIGSNYQFRNLKQSSPQNDIDLDAYTGGFPSVKLTADYGYGYYPTSRTWLTVNWNLSAGYEKLMQGASRKDKEDFMDSFHAVTGPRLQAYYYLSEKLRLNFTFNGELQLTRFKFMNSNIPQEADAKTTATRWNQNLIVALTYSLF